MLTSPPTPETVSVPPKSFFWTFMYYYQFHIGDYKTHTHHLNAIEDIAYRRLLDHYYLHEAPIKQRDIARQIGLREYEQEVLSVLDEFFVSTEDGFINPRADAEIKAFREHQASSAFGALVRDNPSLKPLIDKEVFIKHYMDGTHKAYVASFIPHDVPITPTSSTLDATNTQEPVSINHNPIKNTKKAMVPPIGVTDTVWQDFVSLRKAKKAPISQSALDGIAKEALKAGMTLQAALEMCCMRGWSGFKAEWLAEKLTANQRAANNMHVLTRGATAPKPFWAQPTEVSDDRLLR